MALLTKEQAEKLLTKDKIIQILTARVKEMEGPFVENELEKAKEYVHKFTKWMES